MRAELTMRRGAERLKNIKKIARERGGRCLTQTPVGWNDFVDLACKEGHHWTARSRQVLAGHWCHVCHYQRPGQLEKLQKIARERGGVCLSTEYDPQSVRFRCERGHEWDTRADRIRSGSWCKYCVRRDTLADLQALAEERGGRCVSRQYDRYDREYTWECAAGHRFRRSPVVIRAGYFCPKCVKEGQSVFKARAIIEQRGGVLLTRGRILAQDGMRIRCPEGHEWTMQAYSIVAGRWCRECERSDGKAEAVHAFARERGGRCVSDLRGEIPTVLALECAQGHRFEMSFDKLRWGQWCPICPQSVRHRLGMAEMQRLARQWGGRCLSTRYFNVSVPLLWQCVRGHEFERKPSDVRHRDRWCPVCAQASRAEQRRSDARDRR